MFSRLVSASTGLVRMWSASAAELSCGCCCWAAQVVIKEPGRGVVLVPAELELTQRWHLTQARKAATGEAPRRAFERLLLDAIVGDQSTFIRADEMDTSWDVRASPLRCFHEPSHSVSETHNIRQRTE